MKTNIVAEIMDSPQAPMILKELNQAWEAEQARRQRFQEEMTEEQKVEFIQGEVVIHSPVRKKHNEITRRLVQILSVYCTKHQLGFVGFEKILIRLTRNDYEPDVCFFGTEKAQSLHDDQMFFPAPDLVVEVLSPSTVLRDRGVNFEDYQLHAIAEYWLVDPETQVVEQYHLEEEQYVLMKKAADGHIHSFAMPGLQFPLSAIFEEASLMKYLSTILGK